MIASKQKQIEINFTKEQQKRIRLVFGQWYSKKIVQHFEEMGIEKVKGGNYSDTYIRRVFTNNKIDKNVAVNILEATIREENGQKKASEAFKQKKENILQKKQ